LARKKKAAKPHREPTRQQMAKWQRQQRRQRIIFISGVSVIAATVLMVLVGWYFASFRPLHASVITVNDREFNLQYFMDWLEISSGGMERQEVYTHIDSAVSQIQQAELIRQEADRLGIRASSADIEQRRKEANLPANQAARDIVGNDIISERLLDEYFDADVPETAEQVNTLAMLLESAPRANEIRELLVNGANFTALAAEVSADPVTRDRNGELGWHPRDILPNLLGTPVVEDYAFGAPAGALSQPRYDENIVKRVGYWLIKVTAFGQDPTREAEVYAMVLGSRVEADEVSARLAAGDNFTALAGEYSQLPGSEQNGGFMNVITKGQATKAFDDYVFTGNVTVGEVSPPIRDETISTLGGYWLIRVVDKASEREIDTADRQILKMEAMEEWAAGLLTDPENQYSNSLTEQQKDLAVTEIFRRREQVQ